MDESQQLTSQSLIAMCAILNSTTATGVTQSPGLPAKPEDWDVIYNQAVQTFGILENTWQLWQNASTNEYAIVIQGTQSNFESIVEDLVFPLVQFSLSLGGTQVLSLPRAGDNSKAAGVHAGFLYGSLVMLKDMVVQITDIIPAASTVYITGHSMGAGVATITTNLLDQLQLQDLLPNNINWQTIVFAQPKAGNSSFADEMNYYFANSGKFYNFTQNLDWVPKAPLSFETVYDWPEPNPNDEESQALQKYLPDLESFLKFLERKAESLVNAINTDIAKSLNNYLKTIPKFLGFQFSGSLEIIPSLAFETSGTSITLLGTPGTNPQDPNDFMWQHHASNYYQLISAYFDLPTNFQGG